MNIIFIDVKSIYKGLLPKQHIKYKTKKLLNTIKLHIHEGRTGGKEIGRKDKVGGRKEIKGENEETKKTRFLFQKMI